MLLVTVAQPLPAGSPHVENEYFTMDLPGEFLEPIVARMTNGITFVYQRPHADSSQRTLLQISIVDIPNWSREAMEPDPVGSLDNCLDMFLNEVARTQTRFESNPPASGELDSKPMRKARWLGKADDTHMTGVLQCARAGRHYYVVHMQDAVRTAPSSFAALQSSIRSLRFTH